MLLHHTENNSGSQLILDFNRTHLNNQCKLVLDLLQKGKKLTVREAMVEYGIGDLRRRCKDLRDSGYPVQSRLIDGRFKEYYLDPAA